MTAAIAAPPSGKATPSATIKAAAPHQKASPCGAGGAASRKARSGRRFHHITSPDTGRKIIDRQNSVFSAMFHAPMSPS
jgi:hypothetical protein